MAKKGMAGQYYSGYYSNYTLYLRCSTYEFFYQVNVKPFVIGVLDKRLTVYGWYVIQ